MAYTAGVATDVHHTLARVVCTHCGYQGWENEVCTYDLSPDHVDEVRAARKACKNKTVMRPHPVPPLFASAA